MKLLSDLPNKIWYGLALGILIVAAGFGVVIRSGSLRLERLVLAPGPTQTLTGLPSDDIVKPSAPLSVKQQHNPTYDKAPSPGSAYFQTQTFAELDGGETGSPGTRAARDLLVRTKKGDVAAAGALYDRLVKKGFDEYQRAVFLNTIANIQKRDPRLLENSKFVRFYDGRKKHALEYGIVLSGVTTQKLSDAQMGPAGLLGLLGQRSPKTENIASLEVTRILEGPNTYAFDTDLYNLKSEPEKHVAETNFNDSMAAATHPADVARALRSRGIMSGVRTK